MQRSLDAASKAAHVHVSTIGSSTVGKLPLHLLRFGASEVSPQNVRVLVVGGLHAREWQALCTVQQIVHLLCTDQSSAGGYLMRHGSCHCVSLALGASHTQCLILTLCTL